MIESKGVVRRIFEENGTVFVSFPNHAGYFEFPADNADMRRKVTESRDLSREISFAFNREAKILFVGDGAGGIISRQAPETPPKASGPEIG